MSSSCPHLQKKDLKYACTSPLLSNPMDLVWTDVMLVCEVEETYTTNICRRFYQPDSPTPQDSSQDLSEECSDLHPASDLNFSSHTDEVIADIQHTEEKLTPSSQIETPTEIPRLRPDSKQVHDPTSPHCTFLSSSDQQLWCTSPFLDKKVHLERLDAAFICQVPIWAQNVCGRLPEPVSQVEEESPVEMSSEDVQTTKFLSNEIEETFQLETSDIPTPESSSVSPSTPTIKSEPITADVIEPFVSLIEMEFTDTLPEELEEKRRKQKIAEKRTLMTSSAFSGFFNQLTGAVTSSPTTPKDVIQADAVTQEEHSSISISKEDVIKVGLSRPLQMGKPDQTLTAESEESTYLTRDFISLMGGIDALKTDVEEKPKAQITSTMSQATSLLESVLDAEIGMDKKEIGATSPEISKEFSKDLEASFPSPSSRTQEDLERVPHDLPQIKVVSTTIAEDDISKDMIGFPLEDKKSLHSTSLIESSVSKPLPLVESTSAEKEGFSEVIPGIKIYEGERRLIGKLETLIALADETAEKQPVDLTEFINISRAVKSVEIGLSLLEEEDGLSLEEVSLISEGEKGIIIRLGYSTIHKRLIHLPQTIALLSEGSLRDFEEKLLYSDDIGRFREQRDLDLIASEKSHKFFPLEFWFIPKTEEGIQSVVSAFVDPVHSVIKDTWPLELVFCYEILDILEKTSHFLVIFRDIVNLGKSIGRYLPLREGGRTLQIAFGASTLRQNLVVLGCSYPEGPDALIKDCLSQEGRFKVIKHRASSFGVQQASIVQKVELQDSYTYTWEDLSQVIMKEFPNLFKN
ncbi:MAG: hypothetical protein ACFFCQ_12375 [Promethearchaeota archaeon]